MFYQHQLELRSAYFSLIGKQQGILYSGSDLDEKYLNEFDENTEVDYEFEDNEHRRLNAIFVAKQMLLRVADDLAENWLENKRIYLTALAESTKPIYIQITQNERRHQTVEAYQCLVSGGFTHREANREIHRIFVDIIRESFNDKFNETTTFDELDIVSVMLLGEYASVRRNFRFGRAPVISYSFQRLLNRCMCERIFAKGY